MPAGLAAASAISDKVGSIGGQLIGAAQLYSGTKNLKQDKADLANLSRPFYKIQKEYEENRNLAAVEAGGGLSSASKDLYKTEAQRGEGAAVSALLQGGGDMNMISGIFDKYNRSTMGLAAEDSQAHQKNILHYMDVNKDLAGQKTTQFVVNELQPYENKLKELTERIQGDKANQWGGIQTILGSATGGGAKGPPQTDPHLTPSKVSSGIQSQGDVNSNTADAIARYLSESNTMGDPVLQ